MEWEGKEKETTTEPIKVKHGRSSFFFFFFFNFFPVLTLVGREEVLDAILVIVTHRHLEDGEQKPHPASTGGD